MHIVVQVIQVISNIEVYNFKYCAHTFYLLSVDKAFSALYYIMYSVAYT